MTGSPEEIRAAGGVIWRRSGEAVEVLLVHRPRYDDWSLPKGKAEPGEDAAATALREVAEETGLSCRLGDRIGESRYLAGSRPKRVVYFLMEASGGAFVPTGEVDRVVWRSTGAARDHLTHRGDREILALAIRLLRAGSP
jgi:8-oxo-dGTP diphosphatase